VRDEHHNHRNEAIDVKYNNEDEYPMLIRRLLLFVVRYDIEIEIVIDVSRMKNDLAVVFCFLNSTGKDVNKRLD
jgi:hypothetical protein